MPSCLPEPWGKNMPTQWRGEQLKMIAWSVKCITAGSVSSHSISSFPSEPRDEEGKQALTKDVSTNQKRTLTAQQPIRLGCIQGDAIAPWCHFLNLRADLHHQPTLSGCPARQEECSEDSKELPLIVFSLFLYLSVDSQPHALCVNQISHLALPMHNSLSRENEVV